MSTLSDDISDEIDGATETRGRDARLTEWASRAARLENGCDEMRATLRAVLLFHSGAEWTQNMREDWKELTGYEEATTKTLCDAVREAIKFTDFTEEQ